MKRLFLKILVLQVLALLVISSASCYIQDAKPETGNTENRISIAASVYPEALPFLNGELSADRVSAAFGSYILFSGTSTFPDGTVLVSQLFEDDVPVAWWPDEQEIIVNGGRWEITVRESAKVTASDLEMHAGPGYFFFIWERENPERKAPLYFDLVGPPANN